VRPSALAVLRLMTSSNFVGCSTGRSPGLAPFQNLVHVSGGAPKQISEVRVMDRELWAWLDQPFTGPPTVLIASQAVLDLG
jgi:hypothetical protein